MINHQINFGQPVSGLPENITIRSMEGAVKMQFNGGEVKTITLSEIQGRIGIVEVVDTLRVRIDGRRFNVMLFPEASFEKVIQDAEIEMSWIDLEEGTKTVRLDMQKGIGVAVQRTVNDVVEFWFDGPMLIPA